MPWIVEMPFAGVEDLSVLKVNEATSDSWCFQNHPSGYPHRSKLAQGPGSAF
jgi:hypothetical protein